MVDTYRADNYDELMAGEPTFVQTKVIDSSYVKDTGNVTDSPIFDQVAADAEQAEAEAHPEVTTKSKD